MKTVLADIEQELGYASMHRSELRWSSHVAELSVLVAPEFRRIGLGRALTQEVFNLALADGIEKMIAYMTSEAAGALRSFEELGSQREAALRKHVRDDEGAPHDLLVMSHNVAEFHDMMAALGSVDTMR